MTLRQIGISMAFLFVAGSLAAQNWNVRTVGAQNPAELTIHNHTQFDGTAQSVITHVFTLGDDSSLGFGTMRLDGPLDSKKIATQTNEVWGLSHQVVRDADGAMYFGYIDGGRATVIQSSDDGGTWTPTVLGTSPVHGEIELVLTPFGVTAAVYNAQTHRVEIYGFSFISHTWINLGVIPSGDVYAGIYGGPRVTLLGDKKSDEVYVGWGEYSGGRVFYCFRPFAIPTLIPLGPARTVPVTFGADQPSEVRVDMSGDRLAMMGTSFDGNYTLGVLNLKSGLTRTLSYGPAPTGIIGGTDIAFGGKALYVSYTTPGGILRFCEVTEHAFGLKETELPSIDGGWGTSLPRALPIDLDTVGGRGETMRMRVWFPGSVRVAEYSGCANGRSRLCVTDHRFEISASWKDPQGNTGRARAVPVSGDTGYFWFFDENNIELMVKVLNGCGVNNRQWVFAGGLTDVEVDLTVRDTLTGVEKTYRNPLGTAFQPVQDTSAFDSCSSGPQLNTPTEEELRAEIAEFPVEELACATTGTSLCLTGNRFKLEAAWETKDGTRGNGRAVKLTDDSGYFWFFNDDNVELITKVLPACPVNGAQWVFAAGLTDVRVDLTVTDTLTGAVKQYSNAQGSKFQPILDTSAFPGCP
jgi:hypothetical protein